MEEINMAKKIGLSINRGHYLGRVTGNPEFAGSWVKLYLKTVVPEFVNNEWQEVECIIPLMTDNPKTVKTIQDYVQDERQLYVEGYVKSWQNAQGTVEFGIMITNVKLGSKTMYDPDAQNGNQMQAGGNQASGFPVG
jgi:hypothetical protein